MSGEARCKQCGNTDCPNVTTDPFWCNCPAAFPSKPGDILDCRPCKGTGYWEGGICPNCKGTGQATFRTLLPRTVSHPSKLTYRRQS